MSNLQFSHHGSDQSAQANSRDGTAQDPAADNSSGSINDHFSKLNLSEQTDASTAANDAHLPHTDDSTTIGHDAHAAYGQSSPNLLPQQQYIPGYSIPFHGHPAYTAAPYGFSYPPGYPMYPGHHASFPMSDVSYQYPPGFSIPPGHQPSFPMIGVNSNYPGYPPSSYTYAVPSMPQTSDTDTLGSESQNDQPKDKQQRTYTSPKESPVVVQPVAKFHTPVQIYGSPQLQIVSSKTGFNTWIFNFISVLKEYGLTDIIPGPRGHSKRSPTTTERQNIISTFHYYVKDEFVPEWFFSNSNDTFESVKRAIQLQQAQNDSSQLWHDLKALSYDGTKDAFPFVTKVRSIIQRFSNPDADETVTLIKTAILSSLSGTCLSIVKTYEKLEHDYSLDQLLDDIQYEYDFNSKYKLISSSKRSPTKPSGTIMCKYCNKSGHTIENCYSKKNQENGSRSTGRQKRPVRKNNNINLRSSITSSNSDSSHSLRPTSTSSIVAIAKNSVNNVQSLTSTFDVGNYILLDNGSSITLINDADLLHDVTYDFIVPHIATTQNHRPHARAQGTLKLHFHNNKEISVNAYFVPEIVDNILRIHDLEEQGAYQNPKTRILEDTNGVIFAEYTKFDSLCWLSNRYIIIHTHYL